jgi:hypothetical protein
MILAVTLQKSTTRAMTHILLYAALMIFRAVTAALSNAAKPCLLYGNLKTVDPAQSPHRVLMRDAQ